MRVITASESRSRYREVLQGVADTGEPCLITRAGAEPVVMISLSEYNLLQRPDILEAIARSRDTGETAAAPAPRRRR
jgi:prevent-host-death family protein